MGTLLVTRHDQKIIRFSLSWLVNETYSYIKRPEISETDSTAISLLLQMFQEWSHADLPDLTLVENEVAAATGQPHRDLPPGSLALLKFAVESFLEQIGPVRGEFRIITGLPLTDGESLLSRLRTVLPQPTPDAT